MQITIKEITNRDAEFEQVYNLREEVLRKPIGLSLKDEDQSDDDIDTIVIALLDNKVVGCLMLHPKTDTVVKLRQMGVYDHLQGKGIGNMLMTTAEQSARQKGYTHIILHARQSATPFYKKLGYNITSNLFTEVGIPHIAMEKSIDY
jgi:predicted GNAT family N-acyltransferase